MALKTILDAIEARLTGVSFAIGEEQRAAHAVLPRVVWVPVSEQLQRIQTRAGSPGALWLRESRWELHLRARSTVADADLRDHLDEAEELLAQVVQAIHAQLTPGGYRLEGSGDWQVGDNAVEDGVAYVLPVTLLIPITRATPTTATPTSLPTTMQITQADGDAETDATITVE